jgi:hypothetical protein
MQGMSIQSCDGATIDELLAIADQAIVGLG